VEELIAVGEDHLPVDILPRHVVEDDSRLAGHGRCRLGNLEPLEAGDDLVGQRLRRAPGGRCNGDADPWLGDVEQAADDNSDLVGVGPLDLVTGGIEEAEAVARVAQQVGVIGRRRAGGHRLGRWRIGGCWLFCRRGGRGRGDSRLGGDGLATTRRQYGQADK